MSIPYNTTFFGSTTTNTIPHTPTRFTTPRRTPHVRTNIKDSSIRRMKNKIADDCRDRVKNIRQDLLKKLRDVSFEESDLNSPNTTNSSIALESTLKDIIHSRFTSSQDVLFYYHNEAGDVVEEVISPTELYFNADEYKDLLQSMSCIVFNEGETSNLMEETAINQDKYLDEYDLQVQQNTDDLEEYMNEYDNLLPSSYKIEIIGEQIVQHVYSSFYSFPPDITSSSNQNRSLQNSSNITNRCFKDVSWEHFEITSSNINSALMNKENVGLFMQESEKHLSTQTNAINNGVNNNLSYMYTHSNTLPSVMIPQSQHQSLPLPLPLPTFSPHPSHSSNSSNNSTVFQNQTFSSNSSQNIANQNSLSIQLLGVVYPDVNQHHHYPCPCCQTILSTAYMIFHISNPNNSTTSQISIFPIIICPSKCGIVSILQDYVKTFNIPFPSQNQYIVSIISIYLNFYPVNHLLDQYTKIISDFYLDHSLKNTLVQHNGQYLVHYNYSSPINSIFNSFQNTSTSSQNMFNNTQSQNGTLGRFIYLIVKEKENIHQQNIPIQPWSSLYFSCPCNSFEKYIVK